MRKAIYDPPALFGISFLKQEPTEVEFLGWEPGGHTARIRVVVPKNALGNILARIPPEERVERIVERTVLAADITLIEAES